MIAESASREWPCKAHTPMLDLCRIVNFSEDTAFSIIFKPEVSAAKYLEP